MNLHEAIATLEQVSNPNENRIEICRDRVGNWRVVIDEHLTDVYADGRDKSLTTAIEKALEDYYSKHTVSKSL